MMPRWYLFLVNCACRLSDTKTHCLARSTALPHTDVETWGNDRDAVGSDRGFTHNTRCAEHVVQEPALIMITGRTHTLPIVARGYDVFLQRLAEMREGPIASVIRNPLLTDDLQDGENDMCLSASLQLTHSSGASCHQ